MMVGVPQSVSNNHEYGRYAAESIISYLFFKPILSDFCFIV